MPKACVPDDHVLTPEHRVIIKTIQTGITNYRLQSPLHFALHIDVQFSKDTKPIAPDSRRFTAKIIFANYSTEIIRICGKRPITGQVVIKEKGKWVSLNDSLAQNFPVVSALATEQTLHHWWSANGRVFNWSGLPTEIKEHILQFCTGQAHRYSDYYYRTHPNARKPRIYEVLDQLGDWSALLSVSRQVRALTTRLCLSGNINYNGGLTVASRSPREFKDAITRLSKHYQLVKPNSVPTNRKSQTLASQYLRFPQYHPHLDRYATFMHGIRKLYIKFNFLASLHFFKVTAGGLDRYRRPNFMTCDVLNRLPHLNGLIIVLPSEWRVDKISSLPVQLFHETDPCPRTLHRWIYERAAEVLAPYQDVKLHPFIDESEEQNFRQLHQAFALSVNQRKAKVGSLYNGSDGGVTIDTLIERGTNVTEFRPSEICQNELPGEDVLPPRCWCDVPCQDVFFYVGQ
ncbi:hypothetical protein CC78DRAFT_579425 [Lojkania enalia]|uniref:F-box domain-containing protein n=1 Tax=Lojkania enalia TaxID=147567 RepID=A0A9P4KF29_9PLEO|nr:hypothetical protein CC78DRAFT_579425 [Didymosphaeria enalia]